MKAKFVYENAHFERGKDPREKMKIGSEARTLDVTGIMNPNYFEYNDEEIPQILDQLAGGKPYAPGNKILFTYSIDEDEGLESDHSLDELQMIKDYDFIRFEGKKYPIKKNEGYLKYMGESVHFERGKDPIDAMEIGFDKALELDHNDSDIKAWKYGDMLFILAQEPDYPYRWELEYHPDEYNAVYICTLDDMGEEEVMKVAREEIKKWLGKNESIKFQRGKDPKDAMGVGVAPTAKPTDITLMLEELYMAEKPISDVSHLLDREGDAILIDWDWEKYPNTKRAFKAFKETIKGKLGPFLRRIIVEDHGDGPFYTAIIKREYEELFNQGFNLTRFPHKS